MPGLNGAATESGKKGLNNFHSIMDRRQRERGQENAENLQEAPIVEISETSRPGITVENIDNGALYTKVFETKVGSRLRNTYERGEMPRIHKEFYQALCEVIGPAGKKQIILQPIVDKIKIARTLSLVIQSCLEHYGYMKIRRSKGKLLEFEWLK